MGWKLIRYSGSGLVARPSEDRTMTKMAIANGAGCTHKNGLRRILLGALLVVGQALSLAVGGSVAAQQSYETYYRYLNDYPSDCETGWTEHPQGATHDRDNWYITQEKALWRIPVQHDLKSVSSSDPGVSEILLDHLPVLTKARFNHFGDPAYYEYGDQGFVVVPLEGDGGQGIAVFRADASLSFVTYEPLPQAHAAWCAVDPQGYLYSAPDYDFVTGISKYHVDWETLRYGKPAKWLKPESSLALSGPVIDGLQGGEISPDGKLLYLSMFGYLSFFSGIRVYDMSTGKLIGESSNGSGIFNFEIHTGRFEVAEGLTIWDLDDGRAPHISGQLHVFMFYDDKIGDDNAYLKHYDGTIDVDGIAGIDDMRTVRERTLIKEPTHQFLNVPFKTIGFAQSNAWNGAQINMKAGSYPEKLTLSKPVKLVAKGGTVIIGK